MTNGLQALESMAAAFFAREAAPTPERIREVIALLRDTPMCTDVDADAAELLARRFEERLGVTMTIGAVVTERDYVPWLDESRPTIDPYYWERYRKLLIDQQFPSQVIATLDSVTDRILGLLENPLKEGPWDRRGMVMGHVQSGKTANYTGLVCKAADAGYKLIVIIAGIHNNLRNQTQLRIDEGFVGRDSAKLLSQRDERFIGVGRFDQTRRPVTFTNSVRDFNKTTATGVGIPLQNLNAPAIFVIKKNPSTLKNLLEWLKEHSARNGVTVDAPMLVIDDEADNASINIRHGKEAASRINAQIRDLLSSFERSCYVGYTATPFANIFIDPDTDDETLREDLFPKHFIVSLDPPSNYFGPARVFLDNSEQVIRHIDDIGDLLPLNHKKDFQVGSLPQSLLTAIRAFVLARGIRLCRSHENEHSSMLINASRFTDVQRQLRNEVHNRLRDIQASVRVNGALPAHEAEGDPEIAALHEVWEQEFSLAGFTWPEVLARLVDAAAPISVVEVNSRSAGTLNYNDHRKTGLSVIAVGGFSLSRGLTLEGLIVSYFLRNSMMYDTLMQMGRWFGYRPDYEDLCRIWMPEEAEGWYAHIADSIEELRDELRRMEAAGSTPEEFGLKVRSHPDTLIVTARNKLGSGEKLVVSVGLANRFVETAVLRRDPPTLEANHAAAARLVDRLRQESVAVDSASLVENGWLLTAAPVAPVLMFLSEFKNHPGSILTDGSPLRRYIEERQDTELKEWDVLFASLRQGGEEEPDRSLGLPIIRQKRSAGTRSVRDTLHITNKQRVASRGAERTGLAPEHVAEVERQYRESVDASAIGDEKPRRVAYPDRIYRAVRTRPLLIIHLLRVTPHEKDQVLEPQDVTAWSISFPGTATEETRVEYVVNTTWLREHYQEELDEEEMGGDNE